MKDPRAIAYLEANGLGDFAREWDVCFAQRNGEDVAIVVTRGCEIHFFSLTPGRAMSRKNTLEFLKPLYDAWGYVTTRVPLEETCHKLREKLGFSYMWSDDLFSYWCMTELPFAKAKS